MPVIGKSPSIGKGRNIRQTISFAGMNHHDTFKANEMIERLPFDRSGASFGDPRFGPNVFPLESPTREVFTPMTAPSRPITAPQDSRFTDGHLTCLRAPYIRKKGIYYPGHERKCPDLEDQKNEDFEVPGPGTYHKLHLVNRYMSEYQTKRGTYDMFGPQMDSRKRTAPSYRFGNQPFNPERAPISSSVPELNVREESTTDQSLFSRILRSSQIPRPAAQSTTKMLSSTKDLEKYFNHKTPSVVLPQI